MRNIVSRTWIRIMISFIGCISSHIVYAQSYKEVTMSVGETQTFYLPSSVTSKNLTSVAFYSTGISYVQVLSYTNYSVTVKAIKAFSSPIIVRCDYIYVLINGSSFGGAQGAYDYRITVEGGVDEDSSIEPTSIKFSSSVKALEVGGSVQLTPTILPANAEYTLTWSINNSSVATISQDGVLIGKSEGAADLKVKAQNGVYAMLRVVVSKPTPTSVSVTPFTLSIKEGESKYLSVQVYPSDASQSVTWSSNNTSVATVSNTGKVTAIKAGTATITARTLNGRSDFCSVTCTSAIPSITLSDRNGNVNLPSLANIQYERILYKGWNSLCVPFGITKDMLDAFTTGCKIATVVEIEIIGDKQVLSVKEEESVAAGQACLIYSPKDVICSFNLTNAHLNPVPDHSSSLIGAYQRLVIGPNLYKLADDGSSLGITVSDDAIVGPYRAYIKFDKMPETRAIYAPIEIKLKQIKY